MLAETNIPVRDTDEGYSLYPDCSICCKKTQNGRTSPLYFYCDESNTISDSLELETEYPFIGMKDINKPMDFLSYLQNNVSTVLDNPCCHIEETVSQGLNEFLPIHAGQGQPLDPVDNVISQHADGKICPVSWNSWQGNLSREKPYFVSLIKFSMVAL